MTKKVILILSLMLSSMMASAQNDSVGVYAYVDGSYKQMEPLHSRGTRVIFGTAGNIFPGKESTSRFPGTAKFRLYIPDHEIIVKSYFPFASKYGIRDFGVVEFVKRSDSRYLQTVSVGLFNVESGAKETKRVSVSTNTVRPGVYDMVVTGKPGEYCIMLMQAGGEAYGVFDFAIDKAKKK